MSSKSSASDDQSLATTYEKYYRNKIVSALLDMCHDKFVVYDPKLTAQILPSDIDSLSSNQFSSNENDKLSERSIVLAQDLLKTLISTDGKSSFDLIYTQLRSTIKDEKESSVRFDKLEADVLVGVNNLCTDECLISKFILCAPATIEKPKRDTYEINESDAEKLELISEQSPSLIVEDTHYINLKNNSPCKQQQPQLPKFSTSSSSSSASSSLNTSAEKEASIQAKFSFNRRYCLFEITSNRSNWMEKLYQLERLLMFIVARFYYRQKNNVNVQSLDSEIMKTFLNQSADKLSVNDCSSVLLSVIGFVGICQPQNNSGYIKEFLTNNGHYQTLRLLPVLFNNGRFLFYHGVKALPESSNENNSTIQQLLKVYFKSNQSHANMIRDLKHDYGRVIQQSTKTIENIKRKHEKQILQLNQQQQQALEKKVKIIDDKDVIMANQNREILKLERDVCDLKSQVRHIEHKLSARESELTITKLQCEKTELEKKLDKLLKVQEELARTDLQLVYQAAVERDISVYMFDWVVKVWNMCQKKICWTQNEEFNKYKCPLSKSLLFTTTGISSEDRLNIQSKIKQN
ncbi:unnamed protein product, partial [Didymodactylos carnosus]